jgi:hypothetical protein
MLGDLSFIFDRPIKCKTVKYTDQLDNSSWNVLGFDTLRFIRLIADWSVENIKPDMTPYRMLLDVIVSPKNKKKGTTNIILIRLSSVMIDRFFYFGVLAPLSAIFQLYHGDQF